jgi:DNA-binding Xre family transcriptional regulator
VLRSQMRAAGVTYKMLAERIDMSESSVKRMFGQADMSLSRLAQICKAAGVAMEDVLRAAADATPQADTPDADAGKIAAGPAPAAADGDLLPGPLDAGTGAGNLRPDRARMHLLLAELDRLGLIELNR